MRGFSAPLGRKPEEQKQEENKREGKERKKEEGRTKARKAVYAGNFGFLQGLQGSKG